MEKHEFALDIYRKHISHLSLGRLFHSFGTLISLEFRRCLDIGHLFYLLMPYVGIYTSRDCLSYVGMFRLRLFSYFASFFSLFIYFRLPRLRWTHDDVMQVIKSILILPSDLFYSWSFYFTRDAAVLAPFLCQCFRIFFRKHYASIFRLQLFTWFLIDACPLNSRQYRYSSSMLKVLPQSMSILIADYIYAIT